MARKKKRDWFWIRRLKKSGKETHKLYSDKGKDTPLNAIRAGIGSLLGAGAYTVGHSLGFLGDIVNGSSYGLKATGKAAKGQIKGWTGKAGYSLGASGELRHHNARKQYHDIISGRETPSKLKVAPWIRSITEWVGDHLVSNRKRVNISGNTYKNLNNLVNSVTEGDGKDYNKLKNQLHKGRTINRTTGDISIDESKFNKVLETLIDKGYGHDVSNLLKRDKPTALDDYIPLVTSLGLFGGALYLMTPKYTGYTILETGISFVPELKFFLGLLLFVVGLMLFWKKR